MRVRTGLRSLPCLRFYTEKHPIFDCEGQVLLIEQVDSHCNFVSLKAPTRKIVIGFSCAEEILEPWVPRVGEKVLYGGMECEVNTDVFKPYFVFVENKKEGFLWSVHVSRLTPASFVPDKLQVVQVEKPRAGSYYLIMHDGKPAAVYVYQSSVDDRLYYRLVVEALYTAPVRNRFPVEGGPPFYGPINFSRS